MPSLAQAEAAHYRHLDASYQRSIDDDAEREEAIEEEVKMLMDQPIGMLSIKSDEISDALWAYAAKRVDARKPDND